MNSLTYQELMAFTREDTDKAKANEFKTEEVLREILREQTKSDFSEAIPYFERMGFIKEYEQRTIV